MFIRVNAFFRRNWPIALVKYTCIAIEYVANADPTLLHSGRESKIAFDVNGVDLRLR